MAKEPELRGSIPPDNERWMEERSAAIAHATQRKGMPMNYGHGKPPEGKKKGKAARPSG